MKRNIDSTILLVGTIGLPMLTYTVKFLYLFIGIQLWFHRLCKLLTNVIDSSIIELIIILFVKCENLNSRLLVTCRHKIASTSIHEYKNQ